MNQVARNDRYTISEEARRALDPCIGCMQVWNPADRKL